LNPQAIADLHASLAAALASCTNGPLLSDVVVGGWLSINASAIRELPAY